MRRNHYCVLIALVGLGAALAAPQLASAQTNEPTGTVTVPVISNLIWDITGTNNIEITIPGNHGVSIAFPIIVEQSGSGKISGSGAVVTSLFLVGGANDVLTDGTYKVHGSLTSNNGKGHFLVNVTGTGTAAVPDKKDVTKPRTVHISSAINATFDNTTLTGTERDVASASGTGSIHNTQAVGPTPDTSFFPGDGTWTLALTSLATDDHNKVTGAGTVTLKSGQVLAYTAKGVFKTKDGTSTLVLNGTGDAKGSNLMVKMAGNSITSIKGKIVGQSVNVTF